MQEINYICLLLFHLLYFPLVHMGISIPSSTVLAIVIGWLIFIYFREEEEVVYCVEGSYSMLTKMGSIPSTWPVFTDPRWDIFVDFSWVSSLLPCERVLSCVWLFAPPWTVAHQGPLPKDFSRKEYWSGVSFLPPRDLPDPGIELTSLLSPALEGGFFT